MLNHQIEDIQEQAFQDNFSFDSHDLYYIARQGKLSLNEIFQKDNVLPFVSKTFPSRIAVLTLVSTPKAKLTDPPAQSDIIVDPTPKGLGLILTQSSSLSYIDEPTNVVRQLAQPSRSLAAEITVIPSSQDNEHPMDIDKDKLQLDQSLMQPLLFSSNSSLTPLSSSEPINRASSDAQNMALEVQ